MKKIILLLILSLFISCGSIEAYRFKDNLKITNAKIIEGNYEVFPLNSEKRNYNSAYIILNIFNKENNKSTEAINSFEIKIVNDKYLNFIFKKNGSEIKISRKYFVNNNGFIKLENESQTSGIPYFIGGFQVKKIELGITKNNELIINGSEYDESAILFIPISLPKENFTYKFKKIE
jgi:hypothetical protein